jgi:8-oxo-dGTP diphosphatase
VEQVAAGQRTPALILDVVAWVHVRANRMLVVRARGRDRLYQPGGKREPGEDDWAALSREVREELGVELDAATFGFLGFVDSVAHDQAPGTRVRMACYTAEYRGELVASAEVDEFRFVSFAERGLLAPASQGALDRARELRMIGPG